MSYVLKQNLLASSKNTIKSPYAMTPQYITVHNTANDASAENEIRYMLTNDNQVSYHVAIDDTEAIQAIPFNRNAWHCGDGQGNGNRKSIGVEICYSKSGGARYVAAEENAVQYIAQLLKQFGWGIDRVRKHQDWNGKYCPHRILDECRWISFLKRIECALNDTNEAARKDDDIMQFTIKETKTAVRYLLQQAVDSKKIDKAWLDKFEAGTMTGGDFEGLKIIISQR
ncbi:N-acetylmuramoyl-L-alanine amidase family protein [Lysinibacillus xylanilyticus]|uniref:N-acetylmuramoyl-L-alanine amidase n=1 Tax=Lysinibacillus xylanilyticus TaxID=582475 RepID=A0ABT4EM72_9BACI|nr:N-acetylmuramoyl-L-alanine amidase family protein [Lysinibacillus xylanilyticus]